MLHDDLASHKFQNIGQGFELAAQKLRCQWCWTVVSHTIAGLSTPYSPAPFFGTGGPSFWYRTSVLLGKLYVRIKCVNIHTCLCIQERSPSCIFVHSCIFYLSLGSHHHLWANVSLQLDLDLHLSLYMRLHEQMWVQL